MYQPKAPCVHVCVCVCVYIYIYIHTCCVSHPIHIVGSMCLPESLDSRIDKRTASHSTNDKRTASHSTNQEVSLYEIA